MFSNSGSKVKTLALVQTWIGIAASIIGGIVLMSLDQSLLGFLTMVFGAFLSWLTALALYAIGEAADCAAKAEKNAALAVAMLKAIYPEAARTVDTVQPHFSVAAPMPAPMSAPIAPSKHFCPHCGTPISSYPCSNCGYIPEKDIPVSISETAPGRTQCPICGTEQKSDRLRCVKCGQSFSNH